MQTLIKLLTCLPLSGLLRITSFCRKVSVSRSGRGRSRITAPHSPTRLCCLCWAGWLQHFVWVSQQGWRCMSSLVSGHRNCGISWLVLPDYGFCSRRNPCCSRITLCWVGTNSHGLRATTHTPHTLESCGTKSL